MSEAEDMLARRIKTLADFGMSDFNTVLDTVQASIEDSVKDLSISDEDVSALNNLLEHLDRDVTNLIKTIQDTEEIIDKYQSTRTDSDEDLDSPGWNGVF